MIIIINYHMITINDDISVITNSNTEHCPCCQCELKFFARRSRKYINKFEETKYVLIRRLRCTNPNCNKIHHELPSFLCPYKQHCSETCEIIIDNNIEITNCDPRSIRSIRQWFSQNIKNSFQAYLTSIRRKLHIAETDNQFNLVELMKVKGWLKCLSRTVVNFGFWPKISTA
jgi:hypothetical protein